MLSVLRVAGRLEPRALHALSSPRCLLLLGPDVLPQSPLLFEDLLSSGRLGRRVSGDRLSRSVILRISVSSQSGPAPSAYQLLE